MDEVLVSPPEYSTIHHYKLCDRSLDLSTKKKKSIGNLVEGSLKPVKHASWSEDRGV